MQYLQADCNSRTLDVHPARRDWADFNADKHFEYHTATLQCFNGKAFTVDIDASKVPYAALLHTQLFIRIARYARDHHKGQLVAVNVRNPSTVAKVLNKILAPLVPIVVREKIVFVEDAAAVKKTS